MDSRKVAMLAQAEAVSLRLGIGPLRAQQAEALAHLAQGRAVFAALPTGYGKSLCAWMPAVAWGWRVWILSPLLALIEDQALALAALGIDAVAWSGSLSAVQKRSLADRMACGAARVALLSPERFLRWHEDGFFRGLAGLGRGPDLFVLDEMHCLEDWRGFRDGYAALTAPLRRELQRGALLLGLSASLPVVEVEAWMSELGVGEQYALVSAGLGRANLRLRVIALETESERWLYLASALRGVRAPGAALVYCHSRAEVDEVTRWLRSFGIATVAYHAGLPAPERAARSLAFRAGRLRVVCATSAFGMGIDYPHVDRVIHFSTPRDLLSYWQEVGRAGRDGQAAEAIALWCRSDIARARTWPARERAAHYSLWQAWASGACRKAVVAERLGLVEPACGACDQCAPELLRDGSLGDSPPRAWWTQPSAALPDWILAREKGAADVKRGEA